VNGDILPDERHLTPNIRTLIVIFLLSFPLANNVTASVKSDENSWVRVYVEPPKTPIFLGTTFKVNVSLSLNLFGIGMISYQFELHYDNRLLQSLTVDLPEGHFLTPQDPADLFVLRLEVNQSSGYALVAVTLGGSEGQGPGKMGNGTLATVTFKAEELGKSGLIIQDFLFASAHHPYVQFPNTTVTNGVVEVVLPDFNEDGKVDLSDLEIMRQAFGSQEGDARWNPLCDMDHNSKCDILDLAVVARAYGRTVAG
jgi:hypothetical protein